MPTDSYAQKKKNKTAKNKIEQTKDSYGTINRTSGNAVLTALGQGATISDATRDALRNAIEETYGAFVSSNTTILNDNIIKDEIISLSEGNIVAYEVKSKSYINKMWLVEVLAEISQSKLQSYVQSKGGEVTINTSAYVMNIKLEKLKKENEEKIYKQKIETCRMLLPYCFDYTLEVTEPQDSRHGYHYFHVIVGAKTNQNYKKLFEQTKIRIIDCSIWGDEYHRHRHCRDGFNPDFIPSSLRNHIYKILKEGYIVMCGSEELSPGRLEAKYPGLKVTKGEFKEEEMNFKFVNYRDINDPSVTIEGICGYLFRVKDYNLETLESFNEKFTIIPKIQQ